MKPIFLQTLVGFQCKSLYYGFQPSRGAPYIAVLAHISVYRFVDIPVERKNSTEYRYTGNKSEIPVNREKI